MTIADHSLPRERLDSRIGWREARSFQFIEQDDRLHLAAVRKNEDGEATFLQAIPDTDPAGSFGGRTLPRGVAISDQGDVYLADPVRARILYTRASHPPAAVEEDFAPFVPLVQFPETPPSDHPLRLDRPVDLVLVPTSAATGQFGDCLVIADGARVLWLDRHHIVARHVVDIGRDVLALSSAASGTVFALVASDAGSSLIKLQFGAVVREVALDRAPHSLHALDDGAVFLADHGGVFRVDPDGRVHDPADLSDQTGWTPRALILDGTGPVLTGDCDRQAPLRLYNLPLDKLGALGSTGLRLMTRPARLPRPRRGAWVAGPFDGDRRAFPWHRIALDAEIPSQCRLVVSTHTSDFETSVDQIIGENRWSGHARIDPGDKPELLVRNNAGRYLWLHIEAFGNGVDTPSVTGIDIFGPRDSQLSFLPVPFHQDPESADFLDRFLSLQDEFFAEALATFEGLGAILRPVATPVEFLDWLGSWFDWSFLPEWDEATRREMIATSIVFFRERGTVCGLLRMLRWHTGLDGALPAIIESYRTAAAKRDDAKGGPWLAGEEIGRAAQERHHFTVVLPQDAVRDAQALEQVNRIIDTQKPAHTTHDVVAVRPGLVPGEQGLLGVDAILPDTRPPPLSSGQLGWDLQIRNRC